MKNTIKREQKTSFFEVLPSMNILRASKYTKYYIVILYVCIFCGCDDFLTTPPLDVIAEVHWWKNESQVKMMVDNCYDQIYKSNADHLIPFRDSFTDNATWSNNTAVGNGSFNEFTNKVKDEWKYTEIAQLNYVLEGLEKSREFLADNDYARYTAEVRFLRSFLYYDMLFYFGDIPLITKILTVEESRETSRQPRADVLSFILKELHESLTDITKSPSTESGRVNPDVINALLARIYLHEKDYDKVLTHTQAVIQTGKYELYRAYDNDPEKLSYEELFRPNADGNNKEVIFEKQYSSPLKVHMLNRNLTFNSSPYKGWTGLRPLQNMVNEYECIAGHPFQECEDHDCEYITKRAEIEMSGGYGEYEYRDPRLKTTIITPGWEWKVKGQVVAVYGVEDPNSVDYIGRAGSGMTGFFIIKWVDLEGEEADRIRGEKNMTILRYADILLMKAEALIEKNENLQEVVAILNDIRNRAKMPANITLSSQEKLREQLRHERRIELAFEGLRYYDIIRWRICDKVKDGDVYGFARKNESGTRENIFIEKRVWKGHMYLWPVPQDARDQNQNLTQNKDW